MAKATAINHAVSGNAHFFRDPETGAHLAPGKIEPKEADGKRRGPHEVPASADNLNKLVGKFAK
jgi:hypothetical protein